MTWLMDIIGLLELAPLAEQKPLYLVRRLVEKRLLIPEPDFLGGWRNASVAMIAQRAG